MQRLRPSAYAAHDINSLKFRLQCDDAIKKTGTTEGWLLIKKYLGNKQYNILLGSLKNNKNVIVKFGEPEQIIKEYQFGQEAYDNGLPNFIKFLCAFTCDDTETAIQNQNFLCNGLRTKSENDIGIMVMPYYSDGNIDQHKWHRGNFDVLKNILIQVTWSLLYAFEKTGFVHGDMHAGNVLVRKSKNTSLSYGGLSLDLCGMYAIVMDFGKSYKNMHAVCDVYKSIDRLLQIVLHLENSDIVLENKARSQLIQMITHVSPISRDTYICLKNMIDSMVILYAMSELPRIF
jgi:hypothetical protein